MNGYMPYTSSFVGATGQYPIYDYVNSNIYYTSNTLTVYSSNNVLETSNVLQTQITKTSNLIYKMMI